MAQKHRLNRRTCDRPWESTGWTNNENVIRLLDFMVARGEVAVAGRKGRDRLWDLAERVYPDQPVIPADEAAWEVERRRLAALGIARLTGRPLKIPANAATAPVETSDQENNHLSPLM